MTIVYGNTHADLVLSEKCSAIIALACKEATPWGFATVPPTLARFRYCPPGSCGSCGSGFRYCPRGLCGSCGSGFRYSPPDARSVSLLSPVAQGFATVPAARVARVAPGFATVPLTPARFRYCPPGSRGSCARGFATVPLTPARFRYFLSLLFPRRSLGFAIVLPARVARVARGFATVPPVRVARVSRVARVARVARGFAIVPPKAVWIL